MRSAKAAIRGKRQQHQHQHQRRAPFSSSLPAELLDEIREICVKEHIRLSSVWEEGALDFILGYYRYTANYGDKEETIVTTEERFVN